MGKITVEVKINTFGTMLYSLNHPSQRTPIRHGISMYSFWITLGPCPRPYFFFLNLWHIYSKIPLGILHFGYNTTQWVQIQENEQFWEVTVIAKILWSEVKISEKELLILHSFSYWLKKKQLTTTNVNI